MNIFFRSDGGENHWVWFRRHETAQGKVFVYWGFRVRRSKVQYMKCFNDDDDDFGFLGARTAKVIGAHNF